MQALLLNFRHQGKKAIEKVARNQPAAYLKILALLVPREMKVEHSGGVKAMTDEQLEQGIEAITAMLAARTGEDAKVIEGVAAPALSAPSPRKTRRKVRKTDQAVGVSPLEKGGGGIGGRGGMDSAKVIETAETVALPAPDVVPNGPNKVMDAADTAVGARKRKPRKRKVPSPPGE